MNGTVELGQSASSSLMTYVGQLQILAGKLIPPIDKGAQQFLLEALAALPEETLPTIHWTVRGLTVSALMRIGGERASYIPGWHISIQRIWNAETTTSLRAEVLHCLDLLQLEGTIASTDARVIDAAAYILRNINDPSLNVDAVSRFVRLSRWHLGRLLRRDLGQTYSQLLRQFRVDRASYLLRDSRYSVKEVAAAVGYRYATELNRDFKRIFGLAPLEWRRTRMSNLQPQLQESPRRTLSHN